jgi:hypothetical protein
MSKFLMMLWNDEGGFILSTEAMILWTIAVLGATTGLVAVRNATVTELTEVANTITTFDQSYGYPGISVVSSNGSPSSFVAGSNAVNTPLTPGPARYSLITTGSPLPTQTNYPNIISISSP